LGIWAPLNIIVSIFWGSVLFHEFIDLNPFNQALLFASLGVIIAGVLMIILPKAEGRQQHSQTQRSLLAGVLYAFGAGVLWGSYYIPIKMSQVSVWVATLPLAVGIFIGSALLVLLRQQALARQPGAARQTFCLECTGDYLRVCATGLLWGIGNYGMLLLVDQLGAGKGFTISQLSVVINALIGVFMLKTPPPRTRAAALTLAGCVLATVGGVVLGNLK
jgi:glucose uptake protein